MKKHILFALLVMSVFFSCKDDDENGNTVDITTGLTVHLPLDGDAVDLVSNTTGTIYSVDPAPDRNGVSAKSMQFYPQSLSRIDFGDLDGASFPDNVFTISCWAVAIDTGDLRAVLSKRSPAGPFEYSLDNHFGRSFYTLDNWISSGGGTVYGTDPLAARVPITPGTWHHIAFVADGSVLKVYADGVLQSATDARQSGKSLSNTDAPFVIGAGGAFGVNHYFNGCIDEVRLYNRALDADDVAELAKF